jgi:hypothetical protein
VKVIGYYLVGSQIRSRLVTLHLLIGKRNGIMKI